MKRVLTGDRFIEEALRRMSQITHYDFKITDVNNILYNEEVY